MVLHKSQIKLPTLLQFFYKPAVLFDLGIHYTTTSFILSRFDKPMIHHQWGPVCGVLIALRDIQSKIASALTQISRTLPKVLKDFIQMESFEPVFTSTSSSSSGWLWFIGQFLYYTVLRHTMTSYRYDNSIICYIR